jgi:hypothetical protein
MDGAEWEPLIDTDAPEYGGDGADGVVERDGDDRALARLAPCSAVLFGERT